MEYLVDVQGFRRSSNIFVLKELAIIPIIDSKGVQSTYCLFEPPCKWSRLLREEKSVNEWLENRFHGIPWESGLIPYKKHIHIIQENLKDASKIYVKGLEKKKWLEELLPEKYIINLEDLQCPPSRMLERNNEINCGCHTLRDKGVCAIRNANTYKLWLLKNHNYLENEIDLLAFNLSKELTISDD